MAPLIGDFLSWTARMISGVQVRWTGCRPEPRQRAYIANHTSHLDFVLLWSALPKDLRALTRPIAARDYWGRGSLRRYLARRVFNAVLIERRSSTQPASLEEARRTIEHIAASIGDRHSLIIFPEGGRGTGETVGPFKSGIYHLCVRKPDLELVPAYLENLNRILPKGEVLPVPLMSSLTFGTPFRLEKDESKESFLIRARQAVLGLRPA